MIPNFKTKIDLELCDEILNWYFDDHHSEEWNIPVDFWKVSKVSDRSRGWPEGSLFDSYYTKV